MTVIELIEAGAKRLADAGVAFGHGTSNAFDEAAWLVLWRLGFALDDIDAAAERHVDAHQITQAMELIALRIETRQPAAYLTREAWLQGLPFHVDERSIVPRSFIAEVLAEGSVEPWLGPLQAEGGPAALRVLDLCTGNGSLAVLAAMCWPQAVVDATDISAPALQVARINVDKHGLQNRIALIESDGLRAVPHSYDLILCNPPYVNADSMSRLPAEYLAEPKIALAGGKDGMDFIRVLLDEAPAKMNPHAVLVLEIGNEREHFEAAFPALEVVWLETSAGEDQVLMATREALIDKKGIS